jgi:hypothetical protein
MTSAMTIDSGFNDEVKKLISSDVLNNELDMTKEINAYDHPNLVPARFPTKGSTANDKIGINPNDISGIPFNDDLLRSEKELSGTFIGTQDLKEALGFMKGKTSQGVSTREVNTRKTESITDKNKSIKTSEMFSQEKGVMKDPFSPRNAGLQSPFSLNVKTGPPRTASEFSGKLKFEFPESN